MIELSNQRIQESMKWRLPPSTKICIHEYEYIVLSQYISKRHDDRKMYQVHHKTGRPKVPIILPSEMVHVYVHTFSNCSICHCYDSTYKKMTGFPCLFPLCS